MVLPKKWVLVVALVGGVVCATVLLSLGMEKAVGSSGATSDHVSMTRLLDGEPGLAGAELTSSAAYTVFLPVVGLNAGAPPPLFGVQMYGNVTYTTGLTRVVEAGARWVRLPISWASAEPDNRTSDQYDWTAIDAQVLALTGEGIEPLLMLGGNPKWAAVYPMGPVTDLVDLQEFMGALVERYDGDGAQDAPGSPVVRYWEIYNEPDSTREWAANQGGFAFFGYNGEGYAELLDAIYPVVKAASPKAQIVFGGVAHDNFDYEGGGFDPDFLDDVLSSCVGPCFDVMNFHYYPYYRFRWETHGKGVIGKANYILAKLASYGFDRPLMCTETTWPVALEWGSIDLQSRYVVVANVRGMAAGLLLQNWYALRDVDPSLPGLLDSNLVPRPAFFAYQTLTTQLDKAAYARALTGAETGGGNIEGYVFYRRGPTGIERLDILWYDCPEYSQIPPGDCSPGASQTMTVPASFVKITDLYGNSSVLDDAGDGIVDGKVVLEIGPNPIYVLYNPTLVAMD